MCFKRRSGSKRVDDGGREEKTFLFFFLNIGITLITACCVGV